VLQDLHPSGLTLQSGETPASTASITFCAALKILSNHHIVVDLFRHEPIEEISFK
jgi:hypothetical protein